MNKAYQCSKCKLLQDYGDYCDCSIIGDIRPRYRNKGDAKLCRESFEPLNEKEIWHSEFYWENRRTK